MVLMLQEGVKNLLNKDLFFSKSPNNSIKKLNTSKIIHNFFLFQFIRIKAKQKLTYVT